MKDILIPLLRIAGGGLILLAILHVPIGRNLKWKEEASLMSRTNESVFHVHTFFICVVLVLMGLPCLLEPGIFFEGSRTAQWVTWSLSLFWALRLYFQWFVYQADLWRGRRMETAVHYFFTVIWTLLAAVFALCGAVQKGWLA